MSQSNYLYYPCFTRRYIRSVMKMMGLPKKPKVEIELFASMLQDQELALSINGEALRQVQDDDWSWPCEFSTLSFPTSQTFHGHPVDGTLVTWVDSTTLPGRFESFLGTHGNTSGVDMLSIGEPWLMVAIQNPLDTQPSVNLIMLRGAFSPQQISDFINREAFEHAGGRA